MSSSIVVTSHTVILLKSMYYTLRSEALLYKFSFLESCCNRDEIWLEPSAAPRRAPIVSSYRAQFLKVTSRCNLRNVDTNVYLAVNMALRSWKLEYSY
jgi:hypothetical protein